MCTTFDRKISSVTLAQSLYKISRVAGCLDPGQDWRWLQRLCRRLDLRAKPRDRRNDVVEIKELFRLGRQLMDRGRQGRDFDCVSRALLYRDGLILALFAADPLRLTNVTALEIGRTLIKEGTTWSVDLQADEMKNREPHLAVLPNWAAPCIDRYIHHYRLVFRNAATTSRLWLSRNGRPLDDNSLYRVARKRTYEAFGKPHQPTPIQVLFGNQHRRSPRCQHGSSR